MATQATQHEYDTAQDFMPAISGTPSTTLQNARARIAKLEALRVHDEKTGLLNGKGMVQALTREAARMKRETAASHIFVHVQIDNLESIRAQFGALAAEMAVRIMARTLSGQARECDFLSHSAADEFSLLLVNADQDRVIPRIQTLNLGLNKLSFRWNGQGVPLLASLGIETCAKAQDLNEICEAYLAA
ncbi:MAG: GGDEF domain-containing protein [Alphaproteobacteria bacterium]